MRANWIVFALEIAVLAGATVLLGFAFGWLIALLIGGTLALMIGGGFVYAARVRRSRSG